MRSNILSGPHETSDLTDGTKSLGEFFIKKLSIARNKILMVDSQSEQKRDGYFILKQSIKVAKALSSYGIKAGDRVGIYSENNIEYCTVILGTIFVGATVVPISSFFTKVELTNSYNLSEPSIFFVSATTAGKILELRKENENIKKIISFGMHAECENFEKFIENIDDDCVDHFTCPPQDIYTNVTVILASSGTTGLPKGAELTQLSILSSISNYSDIFSLVPVMIIPSPLSYITGFIFALSALATPIQAVILSKFDPVTYLTCIEKYKAPALFFNQSMMNYYAKYPVEKEYDLSEIWLIFHGGAAVSKNVVQKVQQKLGEGLVLQGYAITECFALTSQNLENTTKGSIGVLQRGTLGKVVDPENGKILGPNEHGELMFRNQRVMKGYVGNEKATLAAFDDDGFFHSGDIGYYNENGEWFIVDRMKELIKYCGMKVYPAEVESVLMGHPAIRDACVVGLPDEECGELPLAFIVQQNSITAHEIIEYASERLSFPQHLRGGVVFLEKMPQNNSGSGKSFRRILKEMAVTMKSKIEK